MFIRSSPFGAAAGEERKKSGDDDGIFERAALGVPCDRAVCERRDAGEDIITMWRMYVFRGKSLTFRFRMKVEV